MRIDAIAAALILLAVGQGKAQEFILNDLGNNGGWNVTLNQSMADLAALIWDNDCPGPYHVATSDGRCVWSCSQGTQPAASGECECQPGLVETGKDQFGRRVCTAPNN